MIYLSYMYAVWVYTYTYIQNMFYCWDILLYVWYFFRYLGLAVCSFQRCLSPDGRLSSGWRQPGSGLCCLLRAGSKKYAKSYIYIYIKTERSRIKKVFICSFIVIRVAYLRWIRNSDAIQSALTKDSICVHRFVAFFFVLEVCYKYDM